ncbi:hypothetical protein BS47DRAFT_18565 [Hydnum rufescens UP504]|uniref:TIGR04076 family protein n=1 Tax=Hydnum rufescens UP504 TaxID=1448309 RepID=A0A9P6BCI9_9AGAM|nr:hypothetical protein BS47DRAFT_18565 [Hydnum rufescens UP504]
MPDAREHIARSEAPTTKADDDSFQLYDLKVQVVVPPPPDPDPDPDPEAPPPRLLCGAKLGDYFTLQGEMLYLPPDKGCRFIPSDRIIWRLASVLPLLAAKQRPTDSNDWMTTDAEIACPDPNCPSRLRIIRTGLRTFSHGETTVVPLDGN